MLNLSSGDVQDLRDIVDSYLRPKDVRDIIERFSLEEAASTAYSASGTNLLHAILRETAGTKQGLELLAFLVKRVQYASEDRERIERILSPYRFVLTEDSAGMCELMPISGGLSLQPQQERLTFIKRHTPPASLHHLTQAQALIGQGKPDLALGECRRALEGLTTSGKFTEALDELFSLGLVDKAPQPKGYAFEYEALKMAYDFCSTRGSHTTATRPAATMEQGLFGLVLAENAVFYLVQTLVNAKARKVVPVRWAPVR